MTSPYFTQEKTCPVCQTKFHVTRVRSSAYSVMRRDTDFHVTYHGINPTYYTVWVCPQCNYAAPDRNFEETLRPAELERLTKGLPLLKSEEPDFSGERNPQVAMRTYELAIRTAQLRNAGPGFQAGLFLKAAWLCRELQDNDLEHEYLSQACKLYEQSFSTESGGAGKLSEPGLMYLIGELNRRTANYSQAVQWFSRAVSHPLIKKEAEIERLSRDQWALAREQAKENPQVEQGQSAANTGSELAARLDAPAIEKETGPVSKQQIKRDRFKNKLFASLYTDQIEWLQKISNNCHAEKKAFIERESIIRAVLDAVMETCPEVPPGKSEDELKNNILNLLGAKKA